MKYLQPTLSGGELAPGLWGRVDLARYAISLAKCRNVISKPTGGAAKRPGTRFCGYAKYPDRMTRIVPFIYSTEIAYMVELGDLYMRFWVGGSLLTNSVMPITGISNAATAVVTSAAHGFVDGDQVVISGLLGGFARINSRTYTVNQLTANTFELVGLNSTGFGAYAGGGSAGRIVEVATPYTAAYVPDVRFTQSADVMYLVHGNVPPKELRRTAANVFELVNFEFRRGPFRSFNADEALVMTTNGVTGNVTLSTNIDTFTADMVGSLVYMEEKELRDVKPWASAEKSPAKGQLRRSDSKVYKLVSVPALSGAGTPYYVTGGVRPIHDVGRAFDGPQDKKFDGVNDYFVGVEWEFLHNTFGLVEITGFTDAQTVSAVVIERLPNSIVGKLPSPAGSWTGTGDGVTLVFPIAGATSESNLDYQVGINGEPIQSNPYYAGGGGVNSGGGGFVRPGAGSSAGNGAEQ